MSSFLSVVSDLSDFFDLSVWQQSSWIFLSLGFHLNATLVHLSSIRQMIMGHHCPSHYYFKVDTLLMMSPTCPRWWSALVCILRTQNNRMKLFLEINKNIRWRDIGIVSPYNSSKHTTIEMKSIEINIKNGKNYWKWYSIINCLIFTYKYSRTSTTQLATTSLCTIRPS